MWMGRGVGQRPPFWPNRMMRERCTVEKELGERGRDVHKPRS